MCGLIVKLLKFLSIAECFVKLLKFLSIAECFVSFPLKDVIRTDKSTCKVSGCLFIFNSFFVSFVDQFEVKLYFVWKMVSVTNSDTDCSRGPPTACIQLCTLFFFI